MGRRLLAGLGLRFRGIPSEKRLQRYPCSSQINLPQKLHQAAAMRWLMRDSEKFQGRCRDRGSFARRQALRRKTPLRRRLREILLDFPLRQARLPGILRLGRRRARLIAPGLLMAGHRLVAVGHRLLVVGHRLPAALRLQVTKPLLRSTDRLVSLHQ